MPTPALFYVPQLWRAKASGAELREQASMDAPVLATIPAGGVYFTVGEDQAVGPRWRLAVAGEPERLLYVRRDQGDPLPPTPRDAELYAGIAAVVAARIEGKPVPFGASAEELAAAAKAAAQDVAAGASERATKYGV